MKLLKRSSKKGFTVIELVVSVAIFVFMTALMISKYSNFDQSVLLTDVAYDTALTIRTAQAYGTSVKGAGSGTVSFQQSYGVHFDTANPTTMILYTDNDANGYYSGTAENISTFSPKRGAKIGAVCVGASISSCTTGPGVLDVYFKRPDPSAHICLNQNCSGSAFGEVVVKNPQGDTRTVYIYENGEITVQNN